MQHRVTINKDRIIGTSRLRLGVTFDQVEPDDPRAGSADARARANAHVERMRDCWFNQHIGAWGIPSDGNWQGPGVWKAPGQYDWTLFDRRMQWIADRKLENVVLTFYAAPEWATIPGKHPRFRQLAEQYEQAFADFCVAATLRALSLGVKVKRAVCWNELKGDGTYGGDWDIVSYTRRYNVWYTAMRSRVEFNAIELAGPYLILENARTNDPVITQRNLATLDYWYEKAIDSSAMAIDYGISHLGTGGALPLDQYMPRLGSYADMTRQLLQRYGLPVWWMEHYTHSETNQYATLDPQFQAASYLSIWRHMALAGAEMALTWGLTGDGAYAPGGAIGSWLTDTRALSGVGAQTPTGVLPGDALPLYHAARAFMDLFGPGTTLYEATSTDPSIQVLASDKGTLYLNTSTEARRVRTGLQSIELGRYEFKVVPEAAKPTVEEIARRVAQAETAILARDIVPAIHNVAKEEIVNATPALLAQAETKAAQITDSKIAALSLDDMVPRVAQNYDMLAVTRARRQVAEVFRQAANQIENGTAPQEDEK